MPSDSPADRNADRFRRDFRARQEDVDAFDALMDEHDIPEPARSALHEWVEQHILDPVVSVYTRALRGVQGRN